MRTKIDKWFKWLAGVVYDRAILFIILSLIVAAGFTSQLPKLNIDTSNESFFHKDDPILLDYEKFQTQFGWDQTVVLALNPKNIFDLDFLQKLQGLHDELEEKVPHLADITSLINARDTRGETNQLIVEDLLKSFPTNEEELADLKDRVMANPLYINRLISPDGQMTSIVLETDMTVPASPSANVLEGFNDTVTGPSIADGPTKNRIVKEVVSVVREIVTKYQSEEFPILVAGSPVVINDTDVAMQKDMGRFLLMATSFVGFCLLLMFRRISGTVFPLIVVLLSLLSTMGFMGFCGVPFTIPNMIMPSFMLAVGVGASVHILSLVYQHFEKWGNKREAISYALGHSGLAVVMTCLTTAGGLASFSTTELAPVASLGIFSGAGVMISLLYTLILLPALLAITPLKNKAKDQGDAGRKSRTDAILSWIAQVSTSYPKAITGVTVVILATGILSASQLGFSHDTLRWLPDIWSSRIATEQIDEIMGGTINLEVLVDTGKENGLYNPVVLKSIDRVAAELEQYNDGRIGVTKVTSVVDILKEIHQALNENRAEFYTVPGNAALIPQEFLLFENSGSDDLEKVIDSSYRLARITIQVPWLDMFYYVPLVREIETLFASELGDLAEVSTTGVLRLFSSTVTAAAHSMGEGYCLAAITITFMMILLLGNLRLGLISMIPNLAPVVLVMGMMYWLGFPLDIFTMMIGAIALGLAVDDTVHFMNGFARYRGSGCSVKEAIQQTLHSSGRAMLVTTTVLAIGFFIYTFAFMENLVRFGLLTSLTIVLALFADFFSVPAILVLLYREKQPETNIELSNPSLITQVMIQTNKE